jgi:hypothetical protein
MANQNRPHARSNYDREEQRDGRTHAVRQTYLIREQRRRRNSRYPEQESYAIEETYRRLGSNRRNYSSCRNMINAAALNAEATPYNRARNSQENETDNKKGNFRGTEWQDHTLFTSERLGGPANSVQALIDTNTGMEILEIAKKIYWIIKAK